MSDKIELKHTSAEEVAHRLYCDVIDAEDQPHQKMQPEEARSYLLSLYAECLHTARGYREWK